MKQFLQISAMAVLTLMFSSFTPKGDGKVILMISLEVKDFAEWKKGFDAGEAFRTKAGIKVISICRATDNDKKVTVIEEATSEKAASDFVALLKEKLKDDFKTHQVTILEKVD